MILVGSLDRRVLAAVHHAELLRTAELRALHVAEDSEAARVVGLRWMELGLEWLPLEIVEPAGSDLVDSIRRAVLAVRDEGYRALTVVVPYVASGVRWRNVLHDHTGGRVAAALANLSAINVVMVPLHLDAVTKRR